jgi:hypothetical protein
VSPLPRQPVVYEINTWPWLRLVGATSLADVPDSVWDGVCRPGIDAVWLMGVWTRSPAGIAVAMSDAGNVASFRSALPDLSDDDVVGSAYCVRDYVVAEHLGGPDSLAAARVALADRGVGVLLDFVANHVAPDHAWCADHPEYFVQGTDDDLERAPLEFVKVGDHVLANGRDPYFAPWRDVVQLNAFATPLRQAASLTVRSIADQCDGVRCDMAMLMLDDVVARTWGSRAGLPPPSQYWTDVIASVQATHPGFRFIAEAYWDREWDLQQLGFDHCYDKRLYDRLLHENAASVRGHLGADLAYQRRLLRFLENHDEPRAAAVFGSDQERAAAVVVATLPGATLWHDGQFDGRRVHLPVFLGRYPDEPLDRDRRAWYESVVALDVRHGDWALCSCEGWPDNHSADQLMAWSWTDGDRRCLVVVNDAGSPAQGRVRVPWSDLDGKTVVLCDRLSGDRYERDGTQMLADGLYVDRPPWGAHVLAVE